MGGARCLYGGEAMKRGLTWVLVMWMSVLTVWTAMLSVGALQRTPPVATAHAESGMLDVRDPVLVRFETGGDNPVALAPPTSMPLWQYVEGGDDEIERRLSQLEAAIEKDLHEGDESFHATHELIDGKEW